MTKLNSTDICKTHEKVQVKCPFENNNVNHAKDNMLMPLNILQEVQSPKYLYINSKILT